MVSVTSENTESIEGHGAPRSPRQGRRSARPVLLSVFVCPAPLCHCVLSGGLNLPCTSGSLAPGLTSHLCPSLNVSSLFQGGDETVGWRRMGEVERWMASLSGQCQSHDERLRDLAASLQKLQLRVDQMDDGREGVSSLVRQAVSQRLKEMSADGLLGPKVIPTSPWGLCAFAGRSRGGSAVRSGAH